MEPWRESGRDAESPRVVSLCADCAERKTERERERERQERERERPVDQRERERETVE